MKHDAIYARYSSHAQDDGTSIDVQLEQCERAAGATCRHYIDRAKTGRAMGGRVQLLAMLADADAGKIRRVFVYKFDRLGRSAETHMIVQQLDDAGVEVVSVTEGKDALARGVQLVVAAHYSIQLSERTKHALVKRFEQGAWTGGRVPFGYVAGERDGLAVLKVDPRQAAIVRHTAQWYVNESVGLQTIARRLNERGDLRPDGGRWSHTPSA